MGILERPFGDVAGQLLGPEINQHHMSVCTAGHDIKAVADQRRRQRLCIFNNRCGIGLEGRGQRLTKGNRLTRDHMHQRTSLQAREYGRIDFLGNRLVIGEDHAAAGPAQSLVGGGGDDMRMGERARMHAGSDKAGEMRHINHQISPNFIGNGTEGREIQMPRVG